MKIKFLILSLILIFTALNLTGCSIGPPGPTVKIEPVELNFWGVFDSSDAFQNIITAYRATHPNVQINYSKLRWEDYEQKLIESWANGTGPDIFMLHNTWLGKYQDKILPLPAQLTVPFVQSSGFMGGDKKISLKEVPALQPAQLKNIFPDVVYNDVVFNNSIYGLPLSVDTLAVFYNRDHFNAANLTSPPTTWQELTFITPLLTLYDSAGDIVRSAISLGGADNINRSNDILSLLMLQNGTRMTDNQNYITFDQESILEPNLFPGQEALRFYTDFALPSKTVYTWNQDLPEALELFSAGKLSMLFGFAFNLPTVQAQAPNINLGIAPIMHINDNGESVSDFSGLPINLASYWNLSVFKRTTHPNEAWDFINFITTQQYKAEDGQSRYYAQDYLDRTQRPPALKALINLYNTNDNELKPFVEQILTAQSWYHGKNPDNMNQIFKQMINNVLAGKIDVAKAIRTAAAAVDQTYR